MHTCIYIQRFDNTFCILLRQWLQTKQTHIGPTLYVTSVYEEMGVIALALVSARSILEYGSYNDARSRFN